MKLIEVKEIWHECEHSDCRHKWKARKKNPRVCPKCHRVIVYEVETPKRVRP